VHYTFQRSTCNTYPLFNELSAEKIVAGVTLGSFFGRSKACRLGITVANNTGAAYGAPTDDIGITVVNGTGTACGAPTDDIGDNCGKQHGRSVQRPYG